MHTPSFLDTPLCWALLIVSGLGLFDTSYHYYSSERGRRRAEL